MSFAEIIRKKEISRNVKSHFFNLPHSGLFAIMMPTRMTRTEACNNDF